MAWYYNYEEPTTQAEAFIAIRDFLADQGNSAGYGIGLDIVAWSYATDADNPAAGDYVIVKFPGEDGKKQCYFKLLFDTDKFYFILSPWLSSSGDGGDLAPNTYIGQSNHALTYVAANVQYLIMFGNKDEFFCFTDEEPPKFGGCGIMDTVFDNTWLTVTNVVDQGSDVWELTLAEELPLTWRANVMVMITSQDSDGTDHVVLCDVDEVHADTKKIVVSNVGFTPRNGARVATDLGIWVSSGDNIHQLTLYIDHNGQNGHNNPKQIKDIVWARYDTEGDPLMPYNSGYYVSLPFYHCNKTDFPYQINGGHKYVFRMELGNPPYHLDTIELARDFQGMACTISDTEAFIFPGAIMD